MLTYTLTMTSEQARTVNKAVELLMRLKINQPEEITRAVMEEGMYGELGVDEFCRRRDRADPHLKAAFQAIFPTWDDVKKDHEWHVLYNVYQAIRYQIHEAEHPQSTGVDSYPPINSGGVGIPKCVFRKDGDGKETKSSKK